MDRGEIITNRSREIPQCRKDFRFIEALRFIDKVMEVFHSLEDMSDLRSMSETGKQLNNAYSFLPLYRADLAQHLITCGYPAFATKILIKLTNMGVFGSIDIFSSTAYFYSTTLSFSNILPDFATALATAGLPKLLIQNILLHSNDESFDSTKTNFLVKSTISIMVNIARISGNRHFFTTESVRLALLRFAQCKEESISSVATVCLAHVVMEQDVSLLSDPNLAGGVDLLHILHEYLNSAQSSEEHPCHSFAVGDLLCALSTCSVHDPLKARFFNMTQHSGSSTVTKQSNSIVNLLRHLIEDSLMAAPNTVAPREGEAAARILWNLAFCDQTQSSHTNLVTAFKKLEGWISEQMVNYAAQAQLTKTMLRALEAIQWRLIRPVSLTLQDSFSDSDTIMFSFAPANRNAVLRIAERLRDTGLPMPKLIFTREALDLTDATSVGMSMTAVNSASHSQWLDSIEQATILVACFSDDYRLSPGCRMEAEYFLSTSSDSFHKTIIPIIVQPNFTATGWLTRLNVSKPAIDFSEEGESHTKYDTLITQLKELMDKAKKRTEPSVNVKTESRKYHSLNGKRNMVLAGETGIARMSSMDESHNQIPSKCRCMASGMMCMGNVYEHKSSTFISRGSQPVATQAWRHVIRPEVRSWSTNQVATWLNSRGLGHIQDQIAAGFDGVLLSQLAVIRFTAPDFFMMSLGKDLKLGLTDRLSFVEALDELAPRNSCLDGENDSLANPKVSHCKPVDRE